MTSPGRKRYAIEQSWSGKRPIEIATINGGGNFVHRIKVDEMAGYILTTSSAGGLFVTDLATDEVLWSLPSVSHCPLDSFE